MSSSSAHFIPAANASLPAEAEDVSKSSYYLFYFDNYVHKKYNAYEVEEVHQALNDQFELALTKKGVKLNDLTWNHQFFKDDISRIHVTVSVSFIHFHRDPKGPERKWMKLIKHATISKRSSSVSTEIVEEEFPKQIPYFYDNNHKDIRYASSLEDIMEKYQSHMFLSMPKFDSEQELHNSVFYEVDNDERDRVMSECVFTYFAPYERKWIRLTRRTAYRVRSAVLSIKI